MVCLHGRPQHSAQCSVWDALEGKTSGVWMQGSPGGNKTYHNISILLINLLCLPSSVTVLILMYPAWQGPCAQGVLLEKEMLSSDPPEGCLALHRAPASPQCLNQSHASSLQMLPCSSLLTTTEIHSLIFWFCLHLQVLFRSTIRMGKSFTNSLAAWKHPFFFSPTQNVHAPTCLYLHPNQAHKYVRLSCFQETPDVDVKHNR